MSEQKALREHLIELLDGGSAHIRIEDAVADFPLDRINEKPGGSPHSAWELLEHIRIAQWDILEFSRNPEHVSPAWPEGYWPTNEGTETEWRNSIEQILNDLKVMSNLVADESTNLHERIPHGDGQTILREAMLVADHNAYHLGQLVLLKRIFET